MKWILWLILIVGYGFLTWAAEKRTFASAALCFFDGGYLAFLCLLLLPCAMGTTFFYGAAAVAALGVLAGLWSERRKGIPAVVFAIATGGLLLFDNRLSFLETLVLAFFGGMGLFHASAGILPEKIEIRTALWSAAGFLLGTFLFVGA